VAADRYAIPEDAFAPLTEEERYGVYVVAGGERPRLLATCARDGIGVAVLGQDDDAREAGLRGLIDLGCFGLLDRLERRWIVLPYGRGDHV
jgi:hypothetical protein